MSETFKEIIFSEEQKRAIRLFENDLVVFAGAGSGKTMLLVERFFHAITKEGISPDNILAITFTEKAAHEMKSRLVRQCEAKGLPQLRQDLENASIGTIHSFCARVLRENPLESGIDPFFRILSDGEARMLVEKTLDQLFEEEAGSAAWLGLLVDYGEGGLRRALKSFYEHSRSIPEGSRIFEPALHRAECERAFEELKAFIRGTLRSLRGEETLSAPEQKLKEVLEEMLSGLEAKSPEAQEMRIARALGFSEKLDKRSKKTKEEVEKLETLVTRWAEFSMEEALFPAKREFLRVFTRFKTFYETEKNKKASYDFEDLVYFVYKLFSSDSPAARRVVLRYQNLYSCMLVDEYQDTSPLQASLIDRLKHENRVFLVGDVQQSIYGFRHADPWVFRRFMENTRYEKISLSRNHRSRREILDWVNRVFTATPAAWPFGRLEAARDFLDPKPHSLEVISVRREPGKIASLTQARIAEARVLAARLQEIIRSGMAIEEKEGVLRPVSYRDFAILFKSTGSSYLYEKELESAGVPFYVLKGKGFYEKQEIVDILCCLEYLENPANDIALACVLRSPLVALSDDALFWLASSARKHAPEAPLSTALGDWDRLEITPEDKQRLKDFIGWCGILRQSKDRMKLSELVRKILLDSRYEAKLVTRSEGTRKLANIRKLLELARLFEEREMTGVSDFTRYLKSLSEEEVPEAEASIESGAGDVVTISTVHAAKGLEFPCVIIADMGAERKKGGLGDLLTSPEMGIGMKWINPLTREPIPDHTYSRIEKERLEKEAAEDERVLYVAMTRAKEHLILSGALGARQKPGASTWMDKVVSILGQEALTTDKAEAGIRIHVVQEMPAPSASTSFTNLAVEIGLQKNHWDAQRLRLDRDAGAVDYEARLAPIQKEYTQTQDLTVTDLLIASLDRADRQAVVFEEDRSPDPEEDEPQTPRNEFGTLFHSAMEYLAVKRPRVIPGSFFESGFLESLNSSERKELKQSVLKFWGGSLGQAIREAKKCYAELPFIYKTGHGVLKGQIDLVFQTPRGEWVILDYKTNRVASAGKQALAQEYEIQLGIYAFIFYKLYGEMPKTGILYFSALDETHEFSYDTRAFVRIEKELEKSFYDAATARS